MNSFFIIKKYCEQIPNFEQLAAQHRKSAENVNGINAVKIKITPTFILLDKTAPKAKYVSHYLNAIYQENLTSYYFQ